EICQELLVPLHSLTSRKPRMLCLPRIELPSGLSLRTMSKFWGPLPRTPSARQFVKIEHTSSSTFKKPKNFRDSHTISTAISRQYVFSSGLLQGFLANLNTKVFPLDKMSLGEAESSNALLHLQGDLLRVIINIFLFHQVMSCLHHVGEKTAIEGSAANQKLIEDLTRQCQQEKDKALALEKEVKRLKGNVEQDGMLARADISSLQREKDQLHEEVVQLKIAAETFPKEMEMAVSGAKIVARWELMREWLKQQTNSWKPAAEFRQYRIFMETEAELKNLPPPSFDDEPEIPDESLDQGDAAYMEHDCFLNSVWCGSARRRRRRLTAKSITSLETSHRLGLEKKHWRRYALVSALMMVLVLGIDAEKAMALGPEGPLMEEFWDNVRRYSVYALTVSTGALSAVFEPIFELLKNPITAVLIFIILGGSFVYEYGY
ncbi:hypothetical protein HID58_042191, partial [Brassica napus]